MIFDLEREFLILHPPRTAGMSIRAALLQASPTAVEWPAYQRHFSAAYFRQRLGATTWGRLFKRVVLRNPFEVIESDWRRCLRDAPNAERACDPWDVQYVRRVASYSDFGEFVLREYVDGHPEVRQAGGFYGLYCLDERGDSLAITAYRFGKLDNAWQEMCRQAGIDATLPHRNSTAGLNIPAVKWWPRAVADIRNLCWRDFDCFNWPTPKTE